MEGGSLTVRARLRCCLVISPLQKDAKICWCAVFEVTDTDGSQVTGHRKLASIKQVSKAARLLLLPCNVILHVLSLL